MTQKLAPIAESLAYFLGGALALFVAVRLGIPLLSQTYGVAPALGWFLTSGVLVTFFFFAAIAAVRRKTGARTASETANALHLRPPTKADITWAIGGLLAVVVLTGAVVTATSRLLSLDLLSKESYASFLQLETLAPHQ